MTLGRIPSFSLIVFGLVALAACSGSPTKEPDTTPTAAPTEAPSSGTTQASADSQKLTPERIMQLQREGYTLVDRNGEQYFCRSEKKTGSRLARETVCMTESQIVALRDQTKRGLARTMREIPPPQGK